MKSLIIYILILLVLSSSATISIYAQERRVNSIYLEFAGVAGNYSLNYDRILRNLTGLLYCSAGGGISVWNNTVINFPVHASLLIGKRAHNLEAGVGILPELYFNKNGNDQSLMLYYSFGYRFQKPDGKIRLNFTISPMFDPSVKWKSTAVGIGAGYVF